MYDTCLRNRGERLYEAVPTCSPSTLEVEVGRSRVQGQGHSQLHSKSEDILSQRKMREKGLLFIFMYTDLASTSPAPEVSQAS